LLLGPVACYQIFFNNQQCGDRLGGGPMAIPNHTRDSEPTHCRKDREPLPPPPPPTTTPLRASATALVLIRAIVSNFSRPPRIHHLLSSSVVRRLHHHHHRHRCRLAVVPHLSRSRAPPPPYLAVILTGPTVDSATSHHLLYSPTAPEP